MLTWLPNGDYTQPGTLKDITNAWPTNRGYRPALAFAVYDDGSAALGTASAAASGYAMFSVGSTAKSFVGHNAKIKSFYDNVDVSRTVGGAYSAASLPFVFAANFDACYATNGIDEIQKFSFATSTAFENIPITAPRFKLLLALGTQLLGFNTTADIVYNGVTHYANGSRWWCSQAGNPDNFEPKVANNSATDTLNDQDGEITAAIELNGYAVVFKRSAIYIGEFVGPPSVMAWRKVHSEYGCVGPYAVTKCDNRLYFVSSTNGGEIASFDGATVTPLSYQVLGSLPNLVRKNPVQADIGGPPFAPSVTYSRTSTATTGDLVYFLQSATSGSLTATTSTLYTFNVRTGRFGFSTYTPSGGGAPLCIWSGAECSLIGAVMITSTPEIRCAAMTTTVKAATYTQYRESYAGKKYTASAGQAYFLGAIPAASIALSVEFPTASASATMATDGKYTFGSKSGARLTQVITMAATDHEITRIELNVGEAGDNKSAVKGIVT